MLPWLVGVQDDLSTLDLAEGGTWEELHNAHVRMLAGPTSPSGFPNIFGAISSRFPASVEITGLGGVSDALVCRLPWDSPKVEQDRNILLGTDRAAAAAYVQSWRKRAIEAASEAFQITQAAERRAYRNKSFFYLKEKSRLEGIPMPDISDDEDEPHITDDEDEGADSGGAAETAGEVDFAELYL